MTGVQTCALPIFNALNRKFISDLKIPERLPDLLSSATFPGNMLLSWDQSDFLAAEGWKPNGKDIISTKRANPSAATGCNPPANLYLPDGIGGVDGCTFDYMRNIELYPDSTKASAFGRGVLDLGGGHTAFAEVSLARARAQRPGLEGVATTRSASWNRAPIDRMSNLNIEPGSSTLEAMIASIELGVMMRTNVSWSIDDSRNKFQFGCEWGRMIRNGRLAEVVRAPGYRGISATFWRSLAMVGDAGTFEVMGTPYCGKGEPSQVIRVGHASPACKFERVAVVGADA